MIGWDVGFELEGRRDAVSAPGPLARASVRAVSLLAVALERERDRLALWLVAGLGAGIVVYFAMPREPPLWVGLAVLVGGVVLLGVARNRHLVPASAGFLILACGLGFFAAEIRTRTVAAPILPTETRKVSVEGTLARIDYGRDGTAKAVIAVTSLSGIDRVNWPARVRLTVRANPAVLVPGQTLRLHAVLQPPTGPAAPGAYDFARRAYFERIGAVGYALGPPTILAAPNTDEIGTRIALLRLALAKRVADALDNGPEAGVAVALVTGLRGDIPEEADTNLRHSGLYHLISISGLHMSVVAFGIFAILRFLLALIEPVALAWPIKKIAAALTLVAAFAYLLFTGAAVPTTRAFVMIALVLLAVIADRRAFTMRNVALAATALLLIAPESLLDVSFQMSFAATTALIAAYETWPLQVDGRPSHIGRVGYYAGGILMSGVVASLATAPFGAYHFQTVTPFGVIANLGAIPISSIVIMPAALGVYVLAPFGWEAPAVALLGAGCRAVLWIADIVAGLPGAVHGVPAGAPLALILMVFSGLWLCLWKTRWRQWGIVPALAGVLLWTSGPRPDVLIDGRMRAIAVRDGSGALTLLRGRATAYQAETWLRRDGQAAGTERAMARCDGVGCVVDLAAGGQLALSENPGSLADDCTVARLVISLGVVRAPCIGPVLIVDRRLLARLGTIAVTLKADEVIVTPAGLAPGSRPWAPPPKPPRSWRTAVQAGPGAQ